MFVKGSRDGWAEFRSVFLRVSLSAAYISALAARFGWWERFGQPDVSWGTSAPFVKCRAKLNSCLPAPMTVAVLATCAEIAPGALATTLVPGIRARLSFSVLPAAAGISLLAAHTAFAMSLDSMHSRARKAGPSSNHWRT